MPIPQGSNNPLVIQFSRSVAEIPELVVSLWCALPGYDDELKAWFKQDMSIDDDTALCPLTEEETAAFPSTRVELIAKGLDENGYTVFWDQTMIDVRERKDRKFRLTQAGG